MQELIRIRYESVTIRINRPTALQVCAYKTVRLTGFYIGLFTFMGCCVRQVGLMPTFRDSASVRFPRVKVPDRLR
jgi:hypothetical protein